MKVLILAGTAEARAAAVKIAAQGHDLVVSIAGLTAAPAPFPGRLRTGGFGGAEGLARWLAGERVGALVDATHPFAARMSAQAGTAAVLARVPLLRLERPGWPIEPGWKVLPDLAAAARAIPAGARVFLTTGRQSFPVFSGRSDVFLLVRAAEDGPCPFASGRLVAGLPPFREQDERALMAGEGIGLLVSRNSGGPRAKLDAARALGVPVLMVARPEKPPVATVTRPGDAAAWLQTLK